MYTKFSRRWNLDLLVMIHYSKWHDSIFLFYYKIFKFFHASLLPANQHRKKMRAQQIGNRSAKDHWRRTSFESMRCKNIRTSIISTSSSLFKNIRQFNLGTPIVKYQTEREIGEIKKRNK